MRLPYRPVIREDEVKGFAGLQMMDFDVDILMYENDKCHGSPEGLHAATRKGRERAGHDPRCDGANQWFLYEEFPPVVIW